MGSLLQFWVSVKSQMRLEVLLIDERSRALWALDANVLGVDPSVPNQMNSLDEAH